jgi:hypothetical protein
MTIFFTYADKRLDIEDLPLAKYAAIHEATGKHWWQVSSSHPATDERVAALLVEACCDVLGIEPVPTLTPKTVVSLFTVDTAENLPTTYQDGIPDPKATEPDPATT